jgi:hypothetical protein
MAAMIHISHVCKLENVSHNCNHQHWRCELVKEKGCRLDRLHASW